MRDKFNNLITEGDTVIYKEAICTVTVETILGVTGYYLKDMSGDLISMFNIQSEELEKKENITKLSNLTEKMIRDFPFSPILPNKTHAIHWIVT